MTGTSNAAVTSTSRLMRPAIEKSTMRPAVVNMKITGIVARISSGVEPRPTRYMTWKGPPTPKSDAVVPLSSPKGAAVQRPKRRADSRLIA